MRHRAVVPAPLIGIADQKRNGGSRRSALIDAGEDFHGIGFPALRHVSALPGLTPVKFLLDICFRQRHPRGAPVDHAADRRPVALTEIRYDEDVTDTRSRHRAPAGRKFENPNLAESQNPVIGISARPAVC